MAKRTLMTCWKQYENLSQSILSGEQNNSKLHDKLLTLTAKANADKIGNALYTLFVKPYMSNCKSVEFTVDMISGVPEWLTDYLEETGTLLVHPISTIRWINNIKNLIMPDFREDEFILFRNISFLIELGKLPSIYLLFLIVLQRVAILLRITHLEKRGGIIEVAEDESYHTLLWAFKEFEQFMKKVYGINARPHFGISWYESDWITGK